MNESAQNALHSYAQSLRAYCRCLNDPSPPLGWDDHEVTTTWTDDAILLPATRRPIRGSRGVTVNLASVPAAKSSESALPRLVSQATGSSTRVAGEDRCAAERQKLHDCYEALRDQLFADGSLGLRLADGFGWKTYEPYELPGRLSESRSETAPGVVLFVLLKMFSEAVEAIAGPTETAASFEGWDEVEERIVAWLNELEQREVHRYVGVAYLNGPICDFEGAVSLTVGAPDADGAISIAAATDSDLSEMIEGYGYGETLPAGLYNCNTVVRVQLLAPVLGAVDEFEALYPKAADVFARVLDVLRIVHGGDIGISAMTVRTTDFGAPGIRPRHYTQYNPAHSPYVPLRLAFSSDPGAPVSEENLADAKRLLALHLRDVDIRGFSVALQRFRDSWERHWPASEERLLDIAIALEALFLNDVKEKELRYRLALRGARFLGTTLPERLSLFREIAQLYDFRSKVAHGATLQNVKAAERSQLEASIRRASEIVRLAIRRMIEGSGPVSLSDEELRAFWQRIELS
jgi:hypothetical protein